MFSYVEVETVLFSFFRWWRTRERFFALHNLKRIGIARPASNCPLAETVNGTEGDSDAALVEPFGNLAIRPVLAAQSENSFTVRLQFAGRSVLRFCFGCLMQIHICLFQPQEFGRTFARISREFAPGGANLKLCLGKMSDRITVASIGVHSCVPSCIHINRMEMNWLNE